MTFQDSGENCIDCGIRLSEREYQAYRDYCDLCVEYELVWVKRDRPLFPLGSS